MRFILLHTKVGLSFMEYEDFANYLAVKHAMGANQAGVHHPLAAGELRLINA